MSLSGARGAAAGSAEMRRRGPRPPGALSVRRRASHGARPRGGHGAVRRAPGCGRSGGLCRRDRCRAPAGTLRSPPLGFLPPRRRGRSPSSVRRREAPPAGEGNACAVGGRGGTRRGGRWAPAPPFWVAGAGPRWGLWRGRLLRARLGRGAERVEEWWTSTEGARSEASRTWRGAALSPSGGCRSSSATASGSVGGWGAPGQRAGGCRGKQVGGGAPFVSLAAFKCKTKRGGFRRSGVRKVWDMEWRCVLSSAELTRSARSGGCRAVTAIQVRSVYLSVLFPFHLKVSLLVFAK